MSSSPANEEKPSVESTEPPKKKPKRKLHPKAAMFTVLVAVLYLAWPTIVARADDAAQQSGQAWYSWILSAFYAGGVKLWHWLLGVLLSLVDKALGAAMDNIPQSWRSGSFQPVINFLGLINYYFPFDVLIAALAAYFVWYGALLLYRIIKSWIPTVSG